MRRPILTLKHPRTITGRVPKEPNIQQIPVRSDLAAQIRAAFTEEKKL